MALLPDNEKAWLVSHKAVYLIGTNHGSHTAACYIRPWVVVCLAAPQAWNNGQTGNTGTNTNPIPAVRERIAGL